MKTKRGKKGRGQAIRHHLNLDGWEVTGVSQLDTHLRLEIEMVNPSFPHYCDPVGKDVVAENPGRSGSKTVNIRDLPLNGEYTDLKAKRLRLRCRHCNTVGAAHAGLDLGKDIHSNHRMTRRLIKYICSQAATRTFREVGREVGLPEATVRKIFKEDRPVTNSAMVIKAPRVLGIDDKHTTGKIKKTMFMDLEEGFLLDVYDANKSALLEPFVKCLDNPHRVVAVCIDMSGTYLKFCRDHLPWATVVIDKFHVVMKANEAVNAARVRAQKALGDDDDEKKRELSSLKLAFLRRKTITPESRADMNRWMKDVPELGAVWEAKERFYGFYSQESAENASDYYKGWLESLDKLTHSHFKTLRDCMKNHNNEILNYFRITNLKRKKKITNGTLEAFNLQVERILHQAPEYSFQTLRHKLLRAFGPDRKKTPEFHRRGLKAGGSRQRKSSKSQRPLDLKSVAQTPIQKKNSKIRNNSSNRVVQGEMFDVEQLRQTLPPGPGRRTTRSARR